jgi:NAD(P) transhydrogenase subunit alpha
VAASDVVITTALIPGKRAPTLLTTEMVEAMPRGSVIVDLAAERGGNCELTKPDEVVVHRGVTIIGPSNPAALVPYHASQMYSKNITTFLAHLLGKDGATLQTLPINLEDEITRETLLTRGGAVVHPRVRDL